VVRCGNLECGKYTWQSNIKKAQKCDMCVRNDLIKEKLAEHEASQSAPPVLDAIKHVQVGTLRHAMREDDHIKWDEADDEFLRRHKELQYLDSKEFLNTSPPPDLFATAQKKRHHQQCLELLRLYQDQDCSYEV